MTKLSIKLQFTAFGIRAKWRPTHHIHDQPPITTMCRPWRLAPILFDNNLSLKKRNSLQWKDWRPLPLPLPKWPELWRQKVFKSMSPAIVAETIVPLTKIMKPENVLDSRVMTHIMAAYKPNSHAWIFLALIGRTQPSGFTSRTIFPLSEDRHQQEGASCIFSPKGGSLAAVSMVWAVSTKCAAGGVYPCLVHPLWTFRFWRFWRSFC